MNRKDRIEALERHLTMFNSRIEKLQSERPQSNALSYMYAEQSALTWALEIAKKELLTAQGVCNV